MSKIMRITMLIIIPFIYIFGGGLMLTLTFMLAAFLDNFESNIIIFAATSSAFIVYMITNLIFYIINIFIREL